MTILFLLRHAHAGDPMKWAGDDDLRPLSDKGRRQAERLGRALNGSDEAPDVLVTSPRIRAEQTARIVAEALGVPVVVDRRLAGPLDGDVVAEVVAAAGGERPCLVGHDPDVSEVLGELVGTGTIPMRKGALARVDFPGHVRVGRGVLRVLLPPDLVPGG
jgi:phosphohistidine phosphatase SixA